MSPIKFKKERETKTCNKEGVNGEQVAALTTTQFIAPLSHTTSVPSGVHS